MEHGEITQEPRSSRDREANRSGALRSRGRVLHAGVWLALLAAPPLAGAAGELDPSFGNGGVIQGSIGPRIDIARDVAIDSQGRILVLSQDDPVRGSAMAVTRYRPDGVLDVTFGVGGHRILKTATFDALGSTQLALDANERIVIGGYEAPSGAPGAAAKILVARLQPNGSMDSSFATAGQLMIPAPAGLRLPRSLRLDPSERILISADQTTPSGSNALVYAILGNGTLDTSFGESGVVTLPLGKPLLPAPTLAVDDDGNILLASGFRVTSGECPTCARFAVHRLLPDGSLDASFGTGGRFVDFTPELVVPPVLIETPAKRIVVGITSYGDTGGGPVHRVVRLLANGAIDANFGASGATTLAQPGKAVLGYDLAGDSSGRIVVAGALATTNFSKFEVLLARLDPTGALDPSFGTAGLVLPKLGTDSAANAITVDADGNLVAAGYISPPIRPDDVADYLVTRHLSGPALALAGALENPQPGSPQSGIGLISGWTCQANEVTAVLDGTWELEASYGTARDDTQGVCGDADNGFGLLYNWALLGDGDHEVVVKADGVDFGRASFRVTTLGSAFLTSGNPAIYTLQNFPTAGSTTRVQWQQAQQSFVILPSVKEAPASATRQPPIAGPGVATSATVPGNLENPVPGSFQSGLSLISGWICDANQIAVKIDEFAPLVAAYGTARGDTAGLCGDTDNGYGLLFNWSLLGDGPHTVRLLADGVEVARSDLTVSTFGTSFLTGASTAKFPLANFPGPEQQVEIQWRQERQNFTVVGADL